MTIGLLTLLLGVSVLTGASGFRAIQRPSPPDEVESVAGRAIRSTTRGRQFCQVYYSLDDGKCPRVRGRVRAELRAGTPTLELGDHTTKPVIVFFHGWPDTNAMWANQFAAFCFGPSAKYACVAPSMMNYNPDVEPVDDQSKLAWPLQADRLHEVITEMGLKNITLVMHDFGSIIGSMYISRYPDTVARAVLLDVGNSPGPPFFGARARAGLADFQTGAIDAYLGQSDTAMDEAIRGVQGIGSPPCADCKIAPKTEVGVGYRTGWMHYNFINTDPTVTSSTYWDTPAEQWEFNLSPDWPDHIPQLFLWATPTFHNPSLLTWLDGRGDGSRHQNMGHDHWFMTRGNASNTNDEIAEFFDATKAVLFRTTLDEQFCQVYYKLDDGRCETIRASVRARVRAKGLVHTLELGDFAETPVMMFLHGFPDTNAMWANQFARFCSGRRPRYSCIAPSIMNFNPDIPPVDDEKMLTWPVQTDLFHDVVVELGLTDITLVIFDAGTIYGSMYVSRYPETVREVVVMDVGNDPHAPDEPGSPEAESNLLGVQRRFIESFRDQSDTAIDTLLQGFAFLPGGGAPCLNANCKITPDAPVSVGWRTAWNFVPAVNDNPAWTSPMFWDTPREEFQFEFGPIWPDNIPQLFLWANPAFHTPQLLAWLDGRGDGSRHRHMGEDHWFQSRSNITETNNAMSRFFNRAERIRRRRRERAAYAKKKEVKALKEGTR